jgi:hypothetical protein
MKIDGFTDVLRSTLRLAGAHYPLHMLAGIAGGIVLHGFLEFASIGAPSGSWLHAVAQLSVVYTIALGILVAVFVILIGGKRLDEQTERDLDLIDRVIERSDLDHLERKLAWRSVLAKAVDAFQPGAERALGARQLAEEAVREISQE